jgi:hypothetical protein
MCVCVCVCVCVCMCVCVCVIEREREGERERDLVNEYLWMDQLKLGIFFFTRKFFSPLKTKDSLRK